MNIKITTAVFCLIFLAVLLLAPTEMQASSVQPPVPAAQTVLHLSETGCYKLDLSIIGGMGEPPLASESNCEGGLYQPGTVVTLTARPAEGSHVHRWQDTDDDASTEIVNQVTMDADKTVGVHYTNDTDPHQPVFKGAPGGVATVPQPPALDAPAAVIGGDERTQVTSTTGLPWRRIALLEITFPDGLAICSGWFAGPSLVVTAGHCLYDSYYGGWAQSVRVIPGKNGSSEPYGWQYAANISTVAGWAQNGMPEYDYGAVFLPNGDLGNQVGWFDYGYYSDAYLAGLNSLNVSGYPGDKPYGTLWTDDDLPGMNGVYFLNYGIDTFGGQSGAPVWRQGSDGKYYALAVHAYAVGGGYPCAYGTNCGVRISKGMAENFQAWGAAKGPETDCTLVAPPTNLSPLHDELVYSDPVVFSWSAVPGSGGYLLQVDSEVYYTEEPSFELWGIRNYEQPNWKVMTLASLDGCYDSEFTFPRRIQIYPPGPPAAIDASDRLYEDRITVSWTAATHAVSYQLYRSTSKNVLGDLFITTVGLNYTDYTAEPGITYYYQVKSCNGLRCGNYVYDTGRRPSNPIMPPTNFRASDGSSSSGTLQLDWDQNLDGDYYEIYRSSSAEEIGENLATVLSDRNSYTDYSAKYYMPYYYRIRTCNSFRCSELSPPDEGFRYLMAPSAVEGSAGLSNMVRITWSSVSGAQFYEVFRWSDPLTEPGTLIASPVSTSYDDLEAPANTYFRYYVRACTTGGCGNTKYGSGWRAGTIPAVPLNVRTSGDSKSFSINCDLVPFATSYQLFRSTSPGEYGVQIQSSGHFFWDSDVTRGTVYYYSIKACNAAGCSDYSTQVSNWLVPDIPRTVNASNGSYVDKIVITWSSVDETSHKIYRSTSSDLKGELIGTTSTTSFEDTSVNYTTLYYYTIIACWEEICSDGSSQDVGWSRIPAPTSVIASNGTEINKIVITWDDVPGALNYTVYRALEPTSGSILVGSPVTNYFEDTDVLLNTTYYYWIRASMPWQVSSDQTTSGWAAMGVPSIPVNLSGSAGETGVKINWDRVPGATFYQVYRSLTESSYGDLDRIVYYHSFGDTPPPYTTYYYFIKACNAAGCSDYSSSAESWRILHAPELLPSSASAYIDRIALDWYPVAYAASYEVYRSVYGEDAYVFIGSASSIPVERYIVYDDYSAIPGTVYSYKVKSCIDEQCGPFSSTCRGWRLLESPSSFSASHGIYNDRISLAWNEVEGAMTYEIYRGYYYDYVDTLLGDSTGSTFEDFFTPPGPTYFFWVRACSGNICSDLSPYDSGWRSMPPPASIAASDGTSGSEVTISWQAVEGKNTYKIYRTTPGGSARLLDNVTVSPYNDTTAVPGILYSYQVSACYQANCSVLSSADSGYRSPPPPSGTGDHDDNSGSLFYEGDWTLQDGGIYGSGSLHTSANPGDFAVFFFEGSCASLHFLAGKVNGTLDIYIDDVYISTLNQYLPGTDFPLQTAPLCVSPGTHTLRLVHAGGGPVNLDAVTVGDPAVYTHQLFMPLFR